tara:strand:+ start:497 stop:1291 length:795 start_codon:yes stop_codon:yes gene_type:complete
MYETAFKWKKFLTETNKIDELVKPENIDIAGFEIKQELNPEFWIGAKSTLNPEIRDKLLQIADDFYNQLGLDVNVFDVTITGSLANYNWSKYSDVDLHIIIDYTDIDADYEFVKEFLKSKKSDWNRKHDVRMFGYEVEVYVQDFQEAHMSTGVYSVLKNEWNKVPVREEVQVNWDDVRHKTSEVISRIDTVQQIMDEGNYGEAVEQADRVKEKIRRMRQCGLEQGGVYSIENLAFKALRRGDYLEQLSDLKTMSYDRLMSVEEE